LAGKGLRAAGTRRSYECLLAAAVRIARMDHTPSLAEIRTLRDEIIRIAAAHGALHVSVFGSVARGEAVPGSDVDLLVEFDQTPSLLQLIALEQSLSDLLGVRVDVVMRHALRPEVGPHILRDVVSL
jgi:uncharacterized protein